MLVICVIWAPWRFSSLLRTFVTDQTSHSDGLLVHRPRSWGLQNKIQTRSRDEDLHFPMFDRASSPPNPSRQPSAAEPVRRHQPDGAGDAGAAAGGRDPLREDQLREEDHRGLQQLGGDGEAAALQLLGEPAVLLHRSERAALAGKDRSVSAACGGPAYGQMTGRPQ